MKVEFDDLSQGEVMILLRVLKAMRDKQPVTVVPPGAAMQADKPSKET